MGIFRGALTTLFREALGNSVFFCTYEYVRYYMHLQLKEASPKHGNLVDMGIGIVSGGLGGVAVSKYSLQNYYIIYEECVIFFSFPISFLLFQYTFSVLVCCVALGCGKNYNTDCPR